MKSKIVKNIKEQAIVNVALSYGYGDTPDCKRDISWFNSDSPSIMEKIDEEFTRLIIKECAGYVRGAVLMGKQPEYIASSLENAFGVK